MKVALFLLLMCGVLVGCPQYEYVEDIFLHVDGSGEMRITGSQKVFTALFGLGPSATEDELEELFDSDELEVVSTDTMTARGCTFFRVRARFEDLTRLAQHRAFQGRAYSLERARDVLYLEARIGGTSVAGRGNDQCGNGRVAFRIHFPSPVRSHNSPTGVERGNRIRWEQAVSERLDGQLLVVQAHFERRTVFGTTWRLLAVSLGIVAVVVGGSLYILVRIGRRELAEETRRDSGA